MNKPDEQAIKKSTVLGIQTLPQPLQNPTLDTRIALPYPILF